MIKGFVILGLKYQVCFSSVLKTCKENFKIGKIYADEMDFPKCEKLCNENSDCRFIFLNINRKSCVMYDSCDSLRTPAFVGTTYGKISCPGTSMLIKYEVNYF